MELLGRERELAAAGRAIDDVWEGSSRVLSLVSEAGLGKTALVTEIREHARAAGMLVLHGCGVEHERAVPFAAAVDALDAASGREELPAERFRAHRAVRALLEELGRERPLALLLDDLHWADEASLELVLHLLRRPPESAQLLVFAARPGDARRSGCWRPRSARPGGSRWRSSRWPTTTRCACSTASPTRSCAGGS